MGNNPRTGPAPPVATPLPVVPKAINTPPPTTTAPQTPASISQVAPVAAPPPVAPMAPRDELAQLMALPPGMANALASMGGASALLGTSAYPKTLGEAQGLNRSGRGYGMGGTGGYATSGR